MPTRSSTPARSKGNSSRNLGIVAEDTPVLSRDGRLHAFPLRWGFLPSADLSSVPEVWIRPFHRKRHGPKRLVDVSFFKRRIRTDLPIRWLLIGRRKPHGPPTIAPASRTRGLQALAANLVLGHGVAQMSEYLLRPNPAGVADLARIAISRSQAAWTLLSRVRPHRFTLGPNPRANLQALLDFIKR